MRLDRLAVACALMAMPFARSPGETGAVAVYRGMCDASAAANLGGGRFAAADDEDNILRIYDRARPGMPESQIDLSDFLGVGDKSPETDLEGAARIGDRIYWITSHGRNAEGKERPNRHRFFATDIVGEGDRPALVPSGVPCRHLLRALIADPRMRPFRLGAAAEKAPKQEGALNIEGLSAMPDGRLLIGFRNPIPGGRALLVPLQHPEAVARGTDPEFGDPILLDLGGLGVRSIELVGGRYLIIAGPAAEAGASRLYSWRGEGSSPSRLEGAALEGFKPEAILAIEGSGGSGCELISDDGTVTADGVPCKRLKDPAMKAFRALRLELLRGH